MSRLGALIVIALLASGAAAAHADNNSDSTPAQQITQKANVQAQEIKTSDNISRADALSKAVALYEELRNSEVEISRELSKYGEEHKLTKDYLKAVTLGYANAEESSLISKADHITKQDMMSVLYKTVINYDDSYAIDGDEADDILNGCFDNAYIDEENRVAYAFMIKQGIISSKTGTEPDKKLTKESCELLCNEIGDLFKKDITFDINDAAITIGANISSVESALGQPDRIDESIYGFDWYVYNSDYANFVMIGVKADRICAVYSNSKGFKTGSVGVGDAYVRAEDYKSDKAFSFYLDANGDIDAILYNSLDKEAACSEASVNAAALEIADMINAKRVKNGVKPMALNPTMVDDAKAKAADFVKTGVPNEDVVYSLGFDPQCVYGDILLADGDLLTRKTAETDTIGVGTVLNQDCNFLFALTEGVNIKSTPSYVMPEKTVETKKDYKVAEVAEVTTPVILAPETDAVVNDGEDVVIKLAMQAASQYHVEVFDVENDNYAVNEYIKTDSTEIRLPAELFKRGADYRAVVSSVTADGTALSSNDVLFSYGDASQDGVVILSPFAGGSTDDDYIGVSWKSEQYHDFLVDLYDSEGKLLASEIVLDKNEAVIRGVDPGEYYVFVTAMSRNTSKTKASASAKVTVNMPEPVITEIVLEPDDVYYLTYEDPEMGVMYFYDEEIIDVEEKKNGKTVTTKKKKLIQKEVKATKAYKELAKNRRKVESIKGEPVLDFLSVAPGSALGQQIVNEASKYLGVPYVWGGTTPSGFDCSGLVQYIMKGLGIDISRVTQTQCKEGTPVAKGDLQPGDLVFFENNGDVHHVGIYIGSGQMIHAPHTGDVVRVADMTSPYYTASYYCARRFY